MVDTSFECCLANVNSLVSLTKRHSFRLFLDGHEPDIVLIAEHKLAESNILEFDAFVVHRQNRRERCGGGTAVLVKDSIGHKRGVLNLENIENTCVCIGKRDGSSLTIVSMCLRPQDQIDIAQLEPLRDLAMQGELVIGADLNASHASWGGNRTNLEGRTVYDFLISCPDLVVAPTSGPTRIGDRSSSYIDIFIVLTGLDIVDPGGVTVYVRWTVIRTTWPWNWSYGWIGDDSTVFSTEDLTEKSYLSTEMFQWRRLTAVLNPSV